MTRRGCSKWVHLDPSGRMENFVSCNANEDIVRYWGEAYVKEPVSIQGNIRSFRSSDERVLHQSLASDKVEGSVIIADICDLKYQHGIGSGGFRLCGGGGALPGRNDLVHGVEEEGVQGTDVFNSPSRSWLDISSAQRLIKLLMEPWDLVSVWDCRMAK